MQVQSLNARELSLRLIHLEEQFKQHTHRYSYTHKPKGLQMIPKLVGDKTSQPIPAEFNGITLVSRIETLSARFLKLEQMYRNHSHHYYHTLTPKENHTRGLVGRTDCPEAPTNRVQITPIEAAQMISQIVLENYQTGLQEQVLTTEELSIRIFKLERQLEHHSHAYVFTYTKSEGQASVVLNGTTSPTIKA